MRNILGKCLESRAMGFDIIEYKRTNSVWSKLVNIFSTRLVGKKGLARFFFTFLSYHKSYLLFLLHVIYASFDVSFVTRLWTPFSSKYKQVLKLPLL